jgi:hypothetical protein
VEGMPRSGKQRSSPAGGASRGLCERPPGRTLHGACGPPSAEFCCSLCSAGLSTARFIIRARTSSPAARCSAAGECSHRYDHRLHRPAGHFTLSVIMGDRRSPPTIDIILSDCRQTASSRQAVGAFSAMLPCHHESIQLWCGVAGRTWSRRSHSPRIPDELAVALFSAGPSSHGGHSARSEGRKP